MTVCDVGKDAVVFGLSRHANVFGQQWQTFFAVGESFSAECFAFAMTVGIVDERIVYLVGGAVGLELHRLSAAAVHHPYANATVVW